MPASEFTTRFVSLQAVDLRRCNPARPEQRCRGLLRLRESSHHVGSSGLSPCRSRLASQLPLEQVVAPLAPMAIRAKGRVTGQGSTHVANGTAVTGEIPVAFADVFPPRDVRYM